MAVVDDPDFGFDDDDVAVVAVVDGGDDDGVVAEYLGAPPAYLRIE